MKVLRSYRITQEVDALLKVESARLTRANGGKPKVSEADVIELSVVRWLSETGMSVAPDRHTVAEAAMKEAESKPPTVEPSLSAANKRPESVAQRRAREAKEHALALAESDTVARMVGREDIEYDLENVTHRSVIAGQTIAPKAERIHYEVQPRKVQRLARPHGSAEPKRRREQS